RRKCEGLTQFLYFGPARKHLLDPEQLLADRVDLVIAPLGRVVALGEGGLATPIHTREFGGGPDDDYVVAASSLAGLHDERPFVRVRAHHAGHVALAVPPVVREQESNAWSPHDNVSFRIFVRTSLASKWVSASLRAARQCRS